MRTHWSRTPTRSVQHTNPFRNHGLRGPSVVLRYGAWSDAPHPIHGFPSLEKRPQYAQCLLIFYLLPCRVLLERDRAQRAFSHLGPPRNWLVRRRPAMRVTPPDVRRLAGIAHEFGSRAVELGPQKLRQIEIGAAEVRLVEAALNEDRPRDVSRPQVGVVEVHADEALALERTAFKIGARKRSPARNVKACRHSQFPHWNLPGRTTDIASLPHVGHVFEIV